MEKFTPGPWRVISTANDGFGIDYNDGNLMRRFVAMKIYKKENAQLIAAAPELLEALEWTIKEIKPLRIKNDAWVMSIEKLINKAKGL